MANRTGIELLPYVCRIVGVSARARLFGRGSPAAPQVRVFHEIPYSAADPGSLTGALRPLMKSLERNAAVAVWGLRSAYQTLVLPPASQAELEPLAWQEARTSSGSLPAGLLGDTLEAGDVREGHREVGYVSVATGELQSRLRPLLDAGFTIESALTPAQAHASIVRQRRTLLPDAAVAVLSVNGRATGLSVIRGDVALVAREWPWGAESERADSGGARSGGGAFAERLASEIRRSLSHLQQARKVDVTRVLVCGDVREIRTLTGPLMDELSLDVETLDVGDDFDLSRLPEPSERFLSRLGAWRTALALATDPAPLPALRSREAGPAVDGVRLGRRVVAAAAAGMLLTAAGWGLLTYLSNDASARQARLIQMVGALEPELQRQDDERRQAVLARAREAAMSAFASQGPRLARIMEALGDAAPADLALSAVRVEPGAASWRITVEGRAEGPDALSAQATLNRFLNTLEASQWLGHPVAPPSLRVRTSDAASPGQLSQQDAFTARDAGPLSSLGTPRPAPAGSAYIEVTRDGQPYRIPLRRQAGNLEADRQPEDVRGREPATAHPSPAAAPTPVATSESPVRHPASLIDFTARYEVAK